MFMSLIQLNLIVKFLFTLGINLRVATLKNVNMQNCDLRMAVLAGTLSRGTVFLGIPPYFRRFGKKKFN